MKILITDEQTGKRLDVFLTETYPDRSRSQLQKLIKQGAITINYKNVTPHHFLKAGDEVAVDFEKKVEEKKGKEKDSQAEKISLKLPALKVVEETDDYLVINKPSGLIIHGAEHINEPTLVDYLLKKYPKIKTVGDDEARPGIVHRLDKDVSGLLVVAKTQKFFEHLKNQFQDRTTDKRYTALVYGKVLKDEGQIKFLIERSATGHKMAAKPANQTGKTAISEFKVLERYINYTLLKVKIITGRTHQVRVHLSAYGTPIVGDNLYGTKLTKDKNKKLNTDRVFLVADELAFTDLAGEKKSFKIDLPGEFKDLLSRVK
ncbi:MAG: Pseudouridine synthase [Parcubacteria group bacterium GW2011_GWE2_39_37]|nr:MAG: Pseudouridine synthase [Parcubacteria group bacterium GW2011_GWE2_39_37]